MELQVKLMSLSENPAKTLVNDGQRTGGSLFSLRFAKAQMFSSADDDAQGKHTFNFTNNGIL